MPNPFTALLGGDQDPVTIEDEESLIPTGTTVESPGAAAPGSLTELEALTKRMADRIDKLYDAEFRRTITQPVLLVIAMIGVLISYYLYPFALVFVVFMCLLLSWNYPILQIPLWTSVVLLIFIGYSLAVGTLTWQIAPVYSSGVNPGV